MRIPSNVKEWMYRHNVIINKNEMAEAEEIFRRAEVSDDWTEWDAYIEKIEKNPPSWWLSKPELRLGKPWAKGSDEYNRETLCIGFPFTGQVVIPNRGKTCTHYDKDANATYVYVQTKGWVGPIETIEVGHGVKIDINPDTGDLYGVEILHEG